MKLYISKLIPLEVYYYLHCCSHGMFPIDVGGWLLGGGGGGAVNSEFGGGGTPK